MKVITALVAAFSVFTAVADVALWTTADKLMPGWGLYPDGKTRGGTKPTGAHAAWHHGRLTWVADFPADQDYTVFVRRYAGSGRVGVAVDERPVAGGRGWTIVDNQSNDRYRWEHLGQARVTAGPHHVDLDIEGVFDAVVFTTNAAFKPDSDPLPEAEKSPVLRAPRRYRDDARLKQTAGRRGYVVSTVPPYEDLFNDHVPATHDVIQSLRLWGAADQYINRSFCVRALRATGPMTVTLRELVGPNRTRIDAPAIDLRVVLLRRRTLNLVETCSRAVLLPDLLLRDDRTGIPPKGKQGGYGGGKCATAIPAHESRQFWLTVRVPAGAPPGLYRGTIRLKNSLFRSMALPVEIEVLRLDLQPVEGYYAMFHNSHPIPPEVRKLDGHYIKPERYRAELADQVRHGCNAATLYGGAPTLADAKAAGTTQAPVTMTWPASDPHGKEYVAQAKALGFPDLYFYGVDEPREPDRLEQCRTEAAWRMQNGYHMFTGINTRDSYEVLKDLVDRPVLSMNAFSGPDNPAVMYARSKGFVPVSYWMASTHYPLWHRALTGLYNTRCGYLGTTPWCYHDFVDHRIWDENDWFQAVAYPDEFEQPIPSRAWEAFREGIDDVRYLQALDRAIAATEKQLEVRAPASPRGIALAAALAKAREVRKSRFESIDGAFHQYLIRLKLDVLDAARREMAEATVNLTAALR